MSDHEEKLARLETALAEARGEVEAQERVIAQVIEERDYAQDVIQETHVALGGDGEWVAKAGQTCLAGETGDLHVDTPALAAQVLAARDAARAECERVRAVVDAARKMPRQTPRPGATSTVHTYQIPASHVWALDEALAALNPADPAAKAGHMAEQEQTQPDPYKIMGYLLAKRAEARAQRDRLEIHSPARVYWQSRIDLAEDALGRFFPADPAEGG